jgi:hypothetical protein
MMEDGLFVDRMPGTAYAKESRCGVPVPLESLL